MNHKFQLFTIFLLLGFFPVFAQDFRIDLDLYDSLSPTSYDYEITGQAALNDSMIIVISVYTSDSLETVLFNGTIDLTNTENSTIGDFTYNQTTGDLAIGLGNFSTLQAFLNIKAYIAGELREELLINMSPFY